MDPAIQLSDDAPVQLGTYWTGIHQQIRQFIQEDHGEMPPYSLTCVCLRIFIRGNGTIVSITPTSDDPNWLRVFMAMQLIRRATPFPKPDSTVYGDVPRLVVLRVSVPQ